MYEVSGCGRDFSVYAGLVKCLPKTVVIIEELLLYQFFKSSLLTLSIVFYLGVRTLMWDCGGVFALTHHNGLFLLKVWIKNAFTLKLSNCLDFAITVTTIYSQISNPRFQIFDRLRIGQSLPVLINRNSFVSQNGESA